MPSGTPKAQLGRRLVGLRGADRVTLRDGDREIEVREGARPTDRLPKLGVGDRHAGAVRENVGERLPNVDRPKLAPVRVGDVVLTGERPDINRDDWDVDRRVVELDDSLRVGVTRSMIRTGVRLLRCGLRVSIGRRARVSLSDDERVGATSRL